MFCTVFPRHFEVLYLHRRRTTRFARASPEEGAKSFARAEGKVLRAPSQDEEEKVFARALPGGGKSFARALLGVWEMQI